MAKIELIDGYTTPEKIACSKQLICIYSKNIASDSKISNITEEIENLPGIYHPDHGGSILLAREGIQLAGCVALRNFAPQVAEMKRFFVHPSFRGRGVGKMLATGIVAEAIRMNYTELRLTTLIKNESAIGIYQTLGFQNIDEYHQDHLPESVFMSLDLTSRSTKQTTKNLLIQSHTPKNA